MIVNSLALRDQTHTSLSRYLNLVHTMQHMYGDMYRVMTIRYLDYMIIQQEAWCTDNDPGQKNTKQHYVSLSEYQQAF